MTTRAGRRPAKPSAAHLRMATVMQTPPPRDLPRAPDLAWTGEMQRGPGDAISGRLSCAGWHLAIVGNAGDDGRTLHLRLTVVARGLIAPEFEDGGLTADLDARHALGSWTLDLARDASGGWTGRVLGCGWALAVVGAGVRPGVLALRAVGEGAA